MHFFPQIPLPDGPRHAHFTVGSFCAAQSATPWLHASWVLHLQLQGPSGRSTLPATRTGSVSLDFAED